MDQLDQLHVVSDLHFGGEPGRQIFDQGDLLAATIDALRERPAALRIGLVLNGDIVDFLAAPGAAYLDPFGAAAKLEAILRDPAFSPVFAALARFVRTERRLLVLALGNHDVELGLPDVEARLLAELCGGDAAARGRVRLALDGTGYACLVGGRRVLAVHGNEVDPWNVVDHGALLRTVRGLRRGGEVPAWEPNAGTRLVIDVMNPIKARYPLVDLLKPETRPVPAVLLALDPSAIGSIRRFAPIAARLGVDRARRAGGFLGGDEIDAGPIDEDAALAHLLRREAPAAAPKTGKAGKLLEEVEELYRAGKDPVELSAGGGTLGFGEILRDALIGDPARELRSSLQGWLRRDDTFSIHTEDDVFRGLDEQTGPGVDFLVAGHTHLARAIPRKRARGYYFNSGTWVRLIHLTQAMLADDESFAPVFDAFRAGSLTALDRVPGLLLRAPTVVSIEAGEEAVSGALNRAEAAGERAHLVEITGSRFELPRVAP
jgi:UDP-2,3-diacylglucosamine pyrophosphatase LpxH